MAQTSSTRDSQKNTSSTNRGVSEIFAPFTDVHSARFDYYRCTVEKQNPNDVYEVLSQIFDRESKLPTRCRNLQPNYHFTEEICTAEGSIQFFYGGYSGINYGVNVCAKGKISNELAFKLQASQLKHSVSRADVCQDFMGDFEVARVALIDHCNKSRMKSFDKGACPESTVAEGRTVHGGVHTSAYQVICYQKGIQLGGEFPTNLLRLEHRFQPKSNRKKFFAKLTPTEMIGTHQGATSLSARLLGEHVQRYTLDIPARQKDPLAALIRQYKSSLSDVFTQHGACGGGELLWSLVQQEKAQKVSPSRLH